jgi:hypothetical protein
MHSLNDTARTASPQHSSHWRAPAWFIVLGIVPLLVCIGCLSLYVFTSPCSLRAQWDDFVGRIPTIPIPPHASVVSERTVDNRSIITSDTQADVIAELYVTLDPVETIVAFYKQHGATCDHNTFGSKPYWECQLPTPTFSTGWVDVDVFEAAAYREIPVDYNPAAYHLKYTVPSSGTLVRTFMSWCVDR